VLHLKNEDFSRDPRGYHDLLNDLDKRAVMADITA
jgi:hypothetical protein